MKSLLQEKELRLSCRRYTPNDYHFSKQSSNKAFSSPGEPSTSVHHERFVYPHDASDIKAHPFFRKVPWDTMHLLKPPFVPKVKNWEDTRYFEEDEPISDVDDQSSYSSSTDHHDPGQDVPINGREQGPEWNANRVQPASEKIAQARCSKEMTTVTTTTKSKRVKDHRRPRDKALRDKDVGKQVLELRKKSAFLGYTYRRLRGTETEELQEKVNRPRFRRGTIPSMS